MAVSKEKFLNLFLDEFRENMNLAENQIIILKNDPDNADALAMLMRTLHTIKGSARMLQFRAIEKLVHGLEEIFKGIRENRYALDAKLVHFFFLVVDRLRLSADRLQRGEAESVADSDLLLEACGKISANETFDLTMIPAMDGSESDSEASALPQSADVTVGRNMDSDALDQQMTDSSIRVDGLTIDRAISLVNNLTIKQLRLRSGIEQLETIEQSLVGAYRSGADLKRLRKDLMEASRRLRQFKGQYSDQLFEIEHGTHELRDSVISMRMLPLSVLLERFPRMVEEAAVSLGKDVRLTIQGSTVRLDRMVLSKLSDPLIHLVRNAVDHGIETAEERQARGKPRHGTISIECRTEGNRISILIKDDGRGLDFEAIRQRAIDLWPENAEELKALGNDELIRFLFKPGFSTKTNSTTLSGRGVGLDIVKNNIEAAKGQIRLESSTGAGCAFNLLLPVSASTMDGMFVLSSGSKYFIPAATITRTLLLDQQDIFSIRQKDMFTLDGINLVLNDLATCLQLERRNESASKIPVLLVRGAGQAVGLRVDKIIGYDSLVYQPLPPCLRKNGLVQGMVFDTSFNIIPILNMWAVLDRLRSVRSMDTHKRFSISGQVNTPNILVVDDSISTREIEISMLTLEGYSVSGAVDGVDALERIHTVKYDLVVSDLNMPRMDGLQLLENIRNDDELKALPVILVTTVEDPAIRQKAQSLGADRYILKSSFDQDNLISAVRQLLAEGRSGQQ